MKVKRDGTLLGRCRRTCSIRCAWQRTARRTGGCGCWICAATARWSARPAARSAPLSAWRCRSTSAASARWPAAPSDRCTRPDPKVSFARSNSWLNGIDILAVQIESTVHCGVEEWTWRVATKWNPLTIEFDECSDGGGDIAGRRAFWQRRAAAERLGRGVQGLHRTGTGVLGRGAAALERHGCQSTTAPAGRPRPARHPGGLARRGRTTFPFSFARHKSISSVAQDFEQDDGVETLLGSETHRREWRSSLKYFLITDWIADL